MNLLNRIITILLFAFVLSSCARYVPFSDQDIMFVKPFCKTDTIVYTSGEGRKDTIIFLPATRDTMQVRNFEQGFYDEIQLSVKYKITAGSYHKFIETHPDQAEEFFSAGVSKSHGSKELCFLGLLFDEPTLNKMSFNSTDVIAFNGADAKYKALNINKWIRSFKFSPQAGVVSYMDNDNREWIGIQKR